MKRKLLSLLLAVLILFAFPASPVLAAELKPFSDVPNDTWYAGYVYRLVQEDIVHGKTPSTFQPTARITRSEFVTMLANYALSETELADYKAMNLFEDVPSSAWYAAQVNWCAKVGITNGKTPTTFRPKAYVTRQEAAAFLVRFAKVTEGVSISPSQPQKPFPDDASISGWAKEDVYLCQTGGIIAGDNKGYFNPRNHIKRSETAKMVCLTLGMEPLPKDQLPVPVVDPSFKEPTVFSKTVAGHSVTGVEFDPRSGYGAQVALANDKLKSTESAGSIVSRKNAYIAVNGSFFNCYSGGDNTTFATIVSGGKLLRADSYAGAKKPTFVIDQDGKASIDYFRTCFQMTYTDQNGKVIEEDKLHIGCNIELHDGDGTKMVYTSAFGKTIPRKVLNAAAVDEDGIVTKVYHNASNVPIPSKGFILFERALRYEGEVVISRIKVGDRVDLKTVFDEGKTTDIQTALSCGPTVVKNGKPYGNASTYRDEGQTDPHVISESGSRMAIGVKKDGKVVIAHTSGTLRELSQVMAGLGCETAMNLDGGASCALWAKGSCLVPAGRNMSNMLVFTKK